MRNHGKCLALALTAGLCMTAFGLLRVSGDDTVRAEPATGLEVIVPLGEPDRSVLAEGDTLRARFKFREAIEAYMEVLNTPNLDKRVRAEAEYNIGMSRTWLGEYEEAKRVFMGMLERYSDDPNAVGYAQFCLAWIEVQEGKYTEAISRLEASLAKGAITDRELAARTRYLIGRTHLLFLNDPDRARTEFLKVLSSYPDTRTAEHPLIVRCRGN